MVPDLIGALQARDGHDAAAVQARREVLIGKQRYTLLKAPIFIVVCRIGNSSRSIFIPKDH
jgi:hypothetical protein